MEGDVQINVMFDIFKSKNSCYLENDAFENKK
jgi:hypothetical protein